ncbi:uncharacterized protein TNCV_4509661 [Trichonephila clavipes]|nr:uncharacterized protein TNCV_4509661 [Trichonephila clavipes]
MLSSVEAYSQGHISSKMPIESVQLWSDSTITLAWINTPPNQLTTFVGNRVSQIQQVSKDYLWKHISSESNPADVLSRELDVKVFGTNDLWWKGPDLQNMDVATPNSLRVSCTVTDQCYTNELKPMSKGTQFWSPLEGSFKYHLKRVVGPEELMLEEFITVIVQIEGILNSRPLTPLSSDTDDFQILTPGHFLIGKPVNAIPEPDIADKKDHNKWQKTQNFIQTI